MALLDSVKLKNLTSWVLITIGYLQRTLIWVAYGKMNGTSISRDSTMGVSGSIRRRTSSSGCRTKKRVGPLLDLPTIILQVLTLTYPLGGSTRIFGTGSSHLKSSVLFVYVWEIKSIHGIT